MNKEVVYDEINNIKKIITYKYEEYNLFLEKLEQLSNHYIQLEINYSIKKTEYDSLNYSFINKNYDVNFDNMLIYSLVKEKKTELDNLFLEKNKFKNDITIVESNINKINLEIASHTEYLSELEKKIIRIDRWGDSNDNIRQMFRSDYLFENQLSIINSLLK
jgi:hypothetical protein|uniref:Uncharacterized protein n=1 Tax=viral metagenome TaxID=1070528 RepID=A0A6C0JSA3_9ZZZZ